MNLRTRVAAIMTVVAITFLNIKICFAEEAFEQKTFISKYMENRIELLKM